jgi:lia operon protein LiaF
MKPSAPGLILIVIGALFLLRNLGIDLHLGQLFATWWPLALIAVGVGMLFKGQTPKA